MRESPEFQATRLAKLVTEELNSNLETYQTELNTIESTIVDVSARLGRLYDALETGKMSLDDLAPRIRELKERQEKLQTRKEELNMFMIGENVRLT